MTTLVSLPKVARSAEQHIRRHGPMHADDIVTELGPEAGTPEHAEAGLRLAIIIGRLALDRDGTIRLPPRQEAAP